jgi:hypothetical protein
MLVDAVMAVVASALAKKPDAFSHTGSSSARGEHRTSDQVHAANSVDENLRSSPDAVSLKQLLVWCCCSSTRQPSSVAFHNDISCVTLSWSFTDGLCANQPKFSRPFFFASWSNGPLGNF